MPWKPFWKGPRNGAAWIKYCSGHPVAVMLGLEAATASGDEMTFTLGATPMANPNGGVHGGLLAAALDHVLAVTAMLAMPEDAMPQTASMNVNFLRPAIPGLELRGRVTSGGRTLVFAHADVFSHDKLAATADGTFAVKTPDRVTMRESTSTATKPTDAADPRAAR